MANPVIQNNDNLQLEVFNPKYKDALIKFATALTYALGVLMARLSVSVGAVTADGGNTGDGTVTSLALAPGGPPLAGSWNLEATAAGALGRAAGAIVPGANTGNGTVTALALAAGGPPAVGDWNLEVTAVGAIGRAAGANTPGANTGDGLITAYSITAGDFPKLGDWTVECTDAEPGGTAAGATAYVGTGNGTADAIVPGTAAIAGLYLITCFNADASGSEIFSVVDPTGNRLDDLVVGVAYSNDHFATTINDGGTDFTVGGVWTLTMTIVHGGLFTLTDPEGTIIKDDIQLPGGAAGTIAVVAGGITFTINDGGTDFIAGDDFTLAVVVAEGGLFMLEDPDGNLISNDIIMPGTAGATLTVVVGGISFIITDGGTDFIVGDSFALTIAAAQGGTFKLEDPNGVIVKNDIVMPGTAGATLTVIVAGMTFILTDGGTDFDTGDKFAMVFTDEELKWVPYVEDALDGSGVAKGVMPRAKTSTGSENLRGRMLIGGEVHFLKLSVQAGGTVPESAIEQLRDFTILGVEGVRTDILDNA